jgi:hypothetical protein
LVSGRAAGQSTSAAGISIVGKAIGAKIHE